MNEVQEQANSQDARVGDWIMTASGKRFWPLDPRPDEVDIYDVCCGLGNTCRFSGLVDRFYSVAEHSIRVAELVPPPLQAAALLHDAAEAYLADVARPLKRLVGFSNLHDNREPGGSVSFIDAEMKLRIIIFQALDVDVPTRAGWSAIHAADARMLANEAKVLFSKRAEPWWEKSLLEPGFRLSCMPPDHALRNDYLNAFSLARRGRDIRDRHPQEAEGGGDDE